MKKLIFIIAGIVVVVGILLITTIQFFGKAVSTEVIISYELKSDRAIIEDKSEIIKLERLFRNSEYENSNKEIEQPILNIEFKDKAYQIDNNDVIQFPDGSVKKAEGIEFDELFQLYEKYIHGNGKEQ